MKAGIETRQMFSKINKKDVDMTNNVVEGYALKFSTYSEDLGGFKEVIEKDALNNTDFSDVRALINHNKDLVIARTTSGTLKIWVDSIGLKFKAQIANTTYGKDLIENIRNGNINQCSFGFILGEKGDKYDIDPVQMIRRRTIKNIAAIVDISFVTYPAYRSSTLTPLKAENHDKEKLKLQLELL